MNKIFENLFLKLDKIMNGLIVFAVTCLIAILLFKFAVAVTSMLIA